MFLLVYSACVQCPVDVRNVDMVNTYVIDHFCVSTFVNLLSKLIMTLQLQVVSVTAIVFVHSTQSAEDNTICDCTETSNTYLGDIDALMKRDASFWNIFLFIQCISTDINIKTNNKNQLPKSVNLTKNENKDKNKNCI